LRPRRRDNEGETSGGDGGDGGDETSGGSVATAGEGEASGGGSGAATGDGDGSEGGPAKRQRGERGGRKTGNQKDITRRAFASRSPV